MEDRAGRLRTGRQRQAARHRVEHPVGGEEEAAPLRSLVRLHREPVGAHSVELPAAVVRLLRRGSHAQRADAAYGVWRLAGHAVHLLEREPVETGGALPTQRGGRVVVEGGEPRQQEAAVPPRGASRDPPRVEPSHARPVGQQLAHAGQPGSPQPHHRHVALHLAHERPGRAARVAVPDGDVRGVGAGVLPGRGGSAGGAHRAGAGVGRARRRRRGPVILYRVGATFQGCAIRHPTVPSPRRGASSWSRSR